MPELPEVETVRKKLEDVVTNKAISSVEVLVPRIIRTPSVPLFIESIKGQQITSVERKGKHLLFILEKGLIVSHLRMEGKYEYIASDVPFNKHDHVIFHFANGFDLRYNDVRKFGTMDYVYSASDVKSVDELGVEPLDPTLTAAYLACKLQVKKTTIKQALLDQSIVAGLGNIYVDEVLFHSGIHPENKANTLQLPELQLLVEAIQQIIATAIQQGGSSIRTYSSMGEKGAMQDLHKVYGKTGKPCVRCTALIQKTKLAGRGTHFCPSCQKL